jgi:hypothetical protein
MIYITWSVKQLLLSYNQFRTASFTVVPNRTTIGVEGAKPLHDNEGFTKQVLCLYSNENLATCPVFLKALSNAAQPPLSLVALFVLVTKLSLTKENIQVRVILIVKASISGNFGLVVDLPASNSKSEQPPPNLPPVVECLFRQVCLDSRVI